MADSSLVIEGLTKGISQTFGSEGGAIGAGEASDLGVRREMKKNGMDIGAGAGGGDSAKAGGGNFADMLAKSVDQVNTFQSQADTAIKELVAGRSKNVHETMLAVERADNSLRMMMQVRNKVLEAYREIMRMQV